MRFTEIAADAFSKIALNAGVLLTDFNPINPATRAEMRTKILGATSGGLNFTATPTYTDFGEDIDNVPNKTMELQRIQYYDVTLGGTMVTADKNVVKRLIGAADATTATGGTLHTITPRMDLSENDYEDIWWVGDYSDKNGATKGGFIAVQIKRSLSTGGFQIQSTDNGKTTLAFTFTGHYTIEDVSDVPFRVYVQEGADEPAA